MPRAAGLMFLCVGLLAASRVAPVQTAYLTESTPDLDDLVLVTQSYDGEGPAGCNALSIFTLQSAQPVYQARDPDPANRVDGLAATTDFRYVFALSSLTSPLAPGYAPRLLQFSPTGGDWVRWAQGPSVIGAQLSYDRSFAVLPDDETMLLELFGPKPDWDRGSEIGRFCLSEIGPDGTLGPQRGAFHGDSTPRQIIPSADGTRAFVVAEHGSHVTVLNTLTMQQVGPTVPMVNDGGDGEPENEYLATISPDERHIVTRRRLGEDAVGVTDLWQHDSWLVPLKGLCPDMGDCGEVAFNHGPVNHGLLAVRGRAEVAVFEFVPRGPFRKLGRWPLNTQPELRWSDKPLAWSGDGSHIIVGTERPNGDELLVLRIEDGGGSVSEVRSLTGCRVREGQKRAQMILTSNRSLSRVPELIPCAPPTPTAAMTSTPISPTPTPEPSATATPFVTSSPITTATLPLPPTPPPHRYADPSPATRLPAAAAQGAL